MMIKRLICGVLAAAVLLFPIGAFACPAEDTAYPSGAVCSAAENGLFFKDLFLESPSVTIYCVPGSAAEKMAIKENIPYENISGYDDSAVIVPDINTLGDIDLSGDITAQDALAE